MEPNLTEAMDEPHEPTETRQAGARRRLDSWVAISVALLATFTGVCKVKDDNIVQAMQQAQADRVDDWNYFQAKNLRIDVAVSTGDQLRVQATAKALAAAAHYDSIARHETAKREEVRRKAEEDQRTYDTLNYRDDQFDLSDALIAVAISLLAITSLTQKRWLFALAMVPTALGVLMGLAGLLGWHVHPDALIRALS
jgi:hypothetical protein